MAKIYSKKRYLNYLYEKTFSILEEHREHDFETDAVTMSVDLCISRANVSRMLNELWREGLLIKIEGRPTYYLHRDCIKSKYREIYIPSVVTKEDDIWKYLVGKIDSESTKLYSGQMIGIENNESLGAIFQELTIQLNYEFNYKAVFFTGEKHTGKNYLIHSVIQHFKLNNRKSLQNFEINWQLMKYDSEYLLSQLKEIEKSFYDNEIVVIYIKNYDYINDSLTQLLFSWLEEYEEITKSENSKALIIFHSDDVTEDELYHLKKMNHSYFVKNFNQKTIKEKYQFILRFIQQEANKIKLSIECPASVINRLLASRYQENLFDLRNEIQMTIARAKYKAENNQSKLLTLSFDELSDKVLNDISNVSEILQEIRKVSYLWKSDVLYFIPDTKQDALTILNNQTVDQQGSISVITDEKISIRRYVQRLFVEEPNQQEIVTLQINNRIYAILQELTNDFCLNTTVLKRLAIETEKIVYNRRNAEEELPFVLGKVDSKDLEEQIDTAIKQLEESLHMKATSSLIYFLEEIWQTAKDGMTITQKMSVLVICHGKDIAEKYVSSVRTRGYDVICDYLNYTVKLQKQSFNDFLKMVKHKAEEIDQGKGVVLLTDTEPLINVAQILSNSTTVKLLNISPISLPLLTEVCQICDKPESTFKDIENSIKVKNTNFFSKGKSGEDVNNQTSSTYQILAESLTFLDPLKVLTVTNDMFTNILDELTIKYREDLQLRFIFHCAFMIERAIRKEPLKMKNVSSVIDKFSEQYQAIEKNIYLINEVFGIDVVIDEMVRLSEIFY